MSWDRKKSTGKYFKARILRIFPALCVMLLITIFGIGPMVTKFTLKEYFTELDTYIYFFRNITLFIFQTELPGVFGNNPLPDIVNGSIWTLSYEFLFYCLVPIFYTLKLFSKDKIKLFFIAVTAANFSIEMVKILDFNFPDNFIINYVLTSVYLFNYFLAGCLFYSYKDKIKFTRKTLYIYIVLMLFTIFIGFPSVSFALFGSYVLFYYSFFTKRIFYNISKYGDFSYGIYIYAFPIQQIISQYYIESLNFIENFISVTLISFFMAFFSWHMVEKKSLRLK